MKYITVMTVPGRSQQVEVTDDATIADAVRAADQELGGYSISVSPHVASPSASTNIAPNSTICLTRQVKGA